MHTLYLSIGSNLSPESNFKKCADQIKRVFTDVLWSPVYKTKPIGMDGPDFLNAAVRVRTNLSLPGVCSFIGELESKLGRIRKENSFSDRTIDVDLLLYDDVCIDSSEITIPRKELSTMGFVLKPMTDIAPNERHPILHQTYQSLLQNLMLSDPEQFANMRTVELAFQ